MAEMQTDQTMLHGTTIAAFDASSEICTAESNEPNINYLQQINNETDQQNAHI